MLPILQLGPLTLRTPGLALLAGLWLALELASREGVRQGLDPDQIYNLGFSSMAAGVLGARLAFVLSHLSLYSRIIPWTRALGTVFSPTSGTEVGWVGLLIGLIVATGLARRWRMPPLSLLDALAVGGAIMVVAVGIAALLGGWMVGVPSTLPWAIRLQGMTRHPTQAYFALAGLAALLAVMRLRRSGPHPPGMVAQVVALALGVGVLLIEPLRADSPVIGPGVRLPAVVALGVIVAAMAGFAARAPAAAEDAHQA